MYDNGKNTKSEKGLHSCLARDTFFPEGIHYGAFFVGRKESMKRENLGRVSKFENFMRQYWHEFGGVTEEQLDQDYIQEQNRLWWERQHPDETEFYKPHYRGER